MGEASTPVVLSGGLIDPIGTFVISNVDAVTRNSAFHFSTPATPGTQRHAARVRRDHGSERQHPSVPGPATRNRLFEMEHTFKYANSQPNGMYNVFVYNYQGQVGNNFRVYFREQATQDL